MSEYQSGAGQEYNPNSAQEEFEQQENAKHHDILYLGRIILEPGCTLMYSSIPRF